MKPAVILSLALLLLVGTAVLRAPGILYSACRTGHLDRDALSRASANSCATTVQVRPFYLTPLLIAPAYFLARPLPTKSS